MSWSFAVPDWWERLQAGRSLLPDLPLDHAEAARAVAIFDRLRLPDVPGQPTLGEAAGEWSRDQVRAIFGSLDPATGVRRVPGTFTMVPKKNSKTTTGGAALMLTGLLVNRRPKAQFGLFGPTQEIADLAFAAAAGMIEADPDLAKLFHVQEHLKRITLRAGEGRGSWLKITTFDMQTATGGKYAGWLLDEAHLLGRAPYASRVIAQLRGAATAIPEQFGAIITTQSDERPAGAFKEELDYARAVRDGKVENPTVLPLIYEFPEALQRADDKPWRNPSLWPAVLPNLGRSVSLDVLTRDFHTAEAKGAEALQIWASQHLNIEIGLGLHSARWIGADYWEGAAEPATLDDILARSDVCAMGVDGGGLDDLLGVAVIGRGKDDAVWRLWAHAWAHPDVLERRKEIAARLRDFEAAGELTVCASATQDIDEAAQVAARLKAARLLPDKAAIGLDPYGVGALVDALDAQGLNGDALAAIPQGFRLSASVWGMERKLKDGTLRHAGQGLMSWCVGNAKAEQRGNAVLITKEAAGKAKIDPLIASFNAFALMARNPQASGGDSYLTRRELVVL